MGTGYVRNDTGNNIADGNVINASDLDGEFDAVQSAFNGSTGHSHDGTSGEGPQIDTAGIADDAVTGAKIDETTTVTAASFVGPVTGNVTGNVTGDVTGNADTATALATGRTVSLTGDVTGTSGSFDGTGNVSITATIVDDSHNHVVGNIDDFTENVQDIAGAMFTGNTESGITATYQDADGTIDLDVNDPVISLSGDVAGSATMTNLGNVDITTTIQANSVALGTDTTGNYVATITSGTGISGSSSSEGGTPTIALSHLGLENLTDPNADRIFFWDDSAGAAQFLTVGSNLTLSGTTLSADAQAPVAGSGIDVSGNTVSIEADLRDGITHIGRDTNDYIAIGTTTIEFAIDGGVRARMENDGDFHADGDVIAYSTTISDERLKTNIVGIENAVAKVGQLNGYTFEYKADGKVSAGVIAQEVEAVLPEAVTEKLLPLKTDDGQEYKVVNYDALHGLLIEAIKELSARVEALEAK